jgi:hypothetical protein
LGKKKRKEKEQPKGKTKFSGGRDPQPLVFFFFFFKFSFLRVNLVFKWGNKGIFGAFWLKHITTFPSKPMVNANGVAFLIQNGSLTYQTVTNVTFCGYIFPKKKKKNLNIFLLVFIFIFL